MAILPHCEKYIEFKNNPNKTTAQFYKMIVNDLKLEKLTGKALEKQFVRGPLQWVKEFKKMTSDSNSGGARISFTEITGLKFVDEFDNKKLVEGFVEYLGNQKKYENYSIEPTKVTKGNQKLATIQSIEQQQKRRN